MSGQDLDPLIADIRSCSRSHPVGSTLGRFVNERSRADALRQLGDLLGGARPHHVNVHGKIVAVLPIDGSPKGGDAYILFS